MFGRLGHPSFKGNEGLCVVRKEHKKWLKDNFGPLVAFDEPMFKYTTFRIGGPATIVTVKTDQQLQKLIRWARENDQPFMILGAGSNLLVLDGGVRGFLIRLANGFAVIEEETEALPNASVRVTAGAGNLVRDLGKYALKRGLTGLNFTLGIPGSVGGALCMNAGAWGCCMADTTQNVTILDSNGHIVQKDRKALSFSYRKLDLEKGSVILRAEFDLQRGDIDALRKDAAQMQKKRMASQPLSESSAGSVFRNPTSGMSAGKLIEMAGLKGLRCGDAEISKKHANFIVNKGHAKASEVITLIERVQKRVNKQFGVALETEVIIVG
jgi:UDP-N-acetylmuramate dehydrogenase